ncbi:endolytic transglycosylase MltG [Senegalia massiliensis]|uniref:Endolytic murein transglycosylase n=1 Tax=Senegalia massiliensis TaxID=1720316 RepID=A0A845QY34_9CLOT|nr:endolytic transglycosylase MltG [Senegalia massiliensis]NBI06709.1 endolytic transglycosylase MltG [Senegalia massiliensis]
MNKMVKVLIISVVLLIIVLGGLKYYYELNTRPVSSDGEQKSVKVEIQSGSTTSDIAKILKENNLIRDKNVFRIVSRIKGTEGKLKAGFYEFDSSMTPEEILNKLVVGGKDGETIKFTIPEGFTIEEIAEKLANENIINKDKFIDLTYDIEKFSKEYKFLNDIPEKMNMEGYLYPNTYQIYKDSTEYEIIKRMLDEFNNKYNEIIKNKEIPLDLSVYELITLASLVEREAKVDKDRNLVSSVIYNRLKIDMPLQIDATIQYALENRKEKLTYDDLEVDSIYNTYKNKGLPVGPICSPGIESINASLNPENTDYIFYVLKKDGSGEHFFTDDYNEFLKVKNGK